MSYARHLLIPHPKQTFLIDQGTFPTESRPSLTTFNTAFQSARRLRCSWTQNPWAQPCCLNTIMPALKSLQGIMEMTGEDSLTLQESLGWGIPSFGRLAVSFITSDVLPSANEDG